MLFFNKFEKQKKEYYDMLSAFRNTISLGSKNEFFIKHHKDKCCLCNNINDLAVDHYPIPFSKILDDYTNLHNVDIYNLKTIELHNMKVLVNKNISDSFKIYHDSKASYRILCISCNSSTGKGSYIPENTYKKRKHSLI